MALEVTKNPDAYTSEERLFLTADRSRVVGADSPEAAFLLVGKGGTIARSEAERYGLLEDAAAEEPEAGTAEEAAPAPKKAAKPAAKKTAKRK
jgi:hypothetical protein